MGSQLGLPHGINKKIKCETKTEMMSMIHSLSFRFLHTLMICIFLIFNIYESFLFEVKLISSALTEC